MLRFRKAAQVENEGENRVVFRSVSMADFGTVTGITRVFHGFHRPYYYY